GILIAIIGAANVLYVDAASFFISFVILSTLVPKRPPIEATEDSGGVLAGIRYIFHDRLLRALAITALFLNMFGQMLAASLPVLAFGEFDGSSAISGRFFAAIVASAAIVALCVAAFGAGAVVGSILALKLVPKFDPIKLGAVALVGLTT